MYYRILLSPNIHLPYDGITPVWKFIRTCNLVSVWGEFVVQWCPHQWCHTVTLTHAWRQYLSPLLCSSHATWIMPVYIYTVDSHGTLGAELYACREAVFIWVCFFTSLQWLFFTSDTVMADWICGGRTQRVAFHQNRQVCSVPHYKIYARQ